MNFKKVYFIFLFIAINNIVFASISQKLDTLKWGKYMPDYVKLQYAGGIGFFSTGIGYTFFNQNMNIGITYGYVPEKKSITALHSISLDISVRLLKYKLNHNIEILPLSFGWYAHHTFGREYWIIQPDKYPRGYYWWSPGLNAGIFLNSEVKTKLLATKTPNSGTAFYIRLSTRGLYLSSKVGNSTIPFTDILELGMGIIIYR